MTKEEFRGKLVIECTKWNGYVEKNLRKDIYTNKIGHLNYNLFSEQVAKDYNGQPWCMAFVSFVLQRVIYSDYFETATNLVTPEDRVSTQRAVKKMPSGDDIVFFSRDGTPETVFHVGIVMSRGDGYIVTCEGNTSISDAIVYDGGRVAWRRRRLNDKMLFRGINYEAIQYSNIGWNKDNNGWWYAYGHAKGEYYKNGTKRIDGHFYTFDNNGYLTETQKGDNIKS